MTRDFLLLTFPLGEMIEVETVVYELVMAGKLATFSEPRYRVNARRPA